MHDSPSRPRVFVTGATGYIGGRLVPRLLAAGYPVRCHVRSPDKLASRAWAADPRVEVVTGRLDDPTELAERMRGCGPAFYLVHSMIAAGADYAAEDRRMAAAFATAAAAAGLTRILYLGGLGETGPGLSEHLRSRREVESILAGGPVPVTIFRAAMIIGSGSASFEILRYLVERLPAMITPRWVRTACQPIAIRDVLHFLVASLDAPATVGRTLDIGGPEVKSYHEIMRIMAEELGLRRRLVVPVPFLTPKLSSLWIHLITPISHRIAIPLADGLRNPVVCRDDEAVRLMPHDRLTIRQAIRGAVEQTRDHDVETIWSAAGPIPGDPDWAGGTVFVDRRESDVAAPPDALFRAVARLGGENGWYSSDLLWRLRGLLDRLAGGPGLWRGRRDPDRIAYGEALDFWRVTALEPGRRLGLRAEMRLPGEALLEFEVNPDPDNPMRSRLVQTARFRPRGLGGLVYWWSVTPFHGVVFDGMLKGIRRAAEAEERR